MLNETKERILTGDITPEDIMGLINTIAPYTNNLVIGWSSVALGIYFYYQKDFVLAKYYEYTEYKNRIQAYCYNKLKSILPFFKAKTIVQVPNDQLKGIKNSKIRLETLDEISKTKKHLIDIIDSEFDRFFFKEILIVLKTYGNISDELRTKFKNKFIDIIEATLSSKEKTIFSQNFDSINTFKLFVINHYLNRLLTLELYLSLGFDATENDITKSYRNFEIYKALLDQKTTKEDTKNISDLVENYFKEDKK